MAYLINNGKPRFDGVIFYEIVERTFMKFELTKVEQSFLNKNNIGNQSTKIPYLIVDNFPDLGLLTALRFLEWCLENLKGVVSLPAGKPQSILLSHHYILNNWGSDDVNNICENYGLNPKLNQNYQI